MVPQRAGHPARRPPAPRARGDGPHSEVLRFQRTSCSPRTRGWSPRAQMSAPAPALLPAHAGMVPRSPGAPADSSSAPRARGDGPFSPIRVEPFENCSPRTRGWSRSDIVHRDRPRLLPAHAGMVLSGTSRRSARRSAPRARGGGPMWLCQVCWGDGCSPRTRGWSLADRLDDAADNLLPAHAGMVPRPLRPPGRAPPAPRARGDGPPREYLSIPRERCSPRTRGWSRQRAEFLGQPSLLPAHAGMVPAHHRGSEAGMHMSEAWTQPPIQSDDGMNLGQAYARDRAVAARAVCIEAMKSSF